MNIKLSCEIQWFDKQMRCGDYIWAEKEGKLLPMQSLEKNVRSLSGLVSEITYPLWL